MKPTSILQAAAALALTAALLPAQAAPVQFDFSATVTTGAFLGQVGSGFIRFDDAVGGGSAIVSSGNGSLEIGFTFLGQTFHETNDQDFPNFPQVTLFDLVPVGIDFVLVDGFSGVDFTNGAIGTVALQGALLPDGGRLLAPVEVQFAQGPGPDPDPGQNVPEPSTYALAGLGLLSLALSRRKTPR